MTVVAPAGTGTLLRKARLEAGLLQWEVAKLAGLSKVHLSAAENGRSRLSPDAARKVGRVVGLTPADLRLGAGAVPSSHLAVSARSHRDIPEACPCDWEIVFARGRFAGWGIALVHPRCACHRTEAGV